MQNDDGVENVLKNKNYSFCLFCVKNSFVSKNVVVEVDVVDLKVLITSILLRRHVSETRSVIFVHSQQRPEDHGY